jgi:uncharacterized protein YjiS (DUF1127 family)
MTDISTQQSMSFPARPERGLRLPLRLLKYLFRSRRTPQIDLRYANEHLLKDIGLRRSHEAPPVPPIGRIF